MHARIGKNWCTTKRLLHVFDAFFGQESWKMHECNMSKTIKCSGMDRLHVGGESSRVE